MRAEQQRNAIGTAGSIREAQLCEPFCARLGLVEVMSTNTTQPRQPRGVPTGGQWRAMARPEGKVALAEPTDEWEGWDQRGAAVAERIASYHPDCQRRWATDSLRDARQAHERAVSLTRRTSTGASLLGLASERAMRERALAMLAAAEKHAGLGRTMVVELQTDASVEKMTSLAGGSEGWCIAADLVKFEPAGNGRWRATGPEWYVRYHVRGVLERRHVGYEVVEIQPPRDGADKD